MDKFVKILRRIVAIILLIAALILLILSVVYPPLAGASVTIFGIALGFWQLIALAVVFIGVAYLVDSDFTRQQIRKFVDGFKRVINGTGEIMRELVQETISTVGKVATSAILNLWPILVLFLGYIFLTRGSGDTTSYEISKHEDGRNE